MTYVRVRSWHSIALTYRSGKIKTRCGLERWTIELGDLGPVAVLPTSETLPLDEKSCESCLRLTQRDEETPPNDPVEEEGPTEDPVDEPDAPGNVAEI